MNNDQASAETLKPTSTGDAPTLRPSSSGEAPTLRSTPADPNATVLGAPGPGESARPAPLITGYEILGELGRGGMGVVYKARHIGLNRIVALKMILSGAHAGAEELQRFRMEGEAVAQLAHPGIVQVFEIGEHEGRPFFTLEFVDGGALTDRLKSGPLNTGDAARVLETLSRTMHAAHLKKIIHRDLKPANVLLTREGAPKITDFGLAKRLDSAEGLTASGAIMGTPAYMAPEQARGQIREIGPRTDVYALGAILYELLTGRAPFRGATSIELLQQVADVAPQKPRSFSSNVDPALEAICLKCLEKNPDDRYPSAELLAADLAAFLRGDRVLAEQNRNLRVLQLLTRDTRHMEVMARFRRVNMANASTIFVFSILTEILQRTATVSTPVLAGVWALGALIILFNVWWFRYRDPLPAALIERQISMVFAFFLLVAILTGVLMYHQGQTPPEILPVLFVEASFAVGAMAIIMGGTFYVASVLTALLGLAMGFVPALGIGASGALLSLIIFGSVWKFSPEVDAAKAA